MTTKTFEQEFEAAYREYRRLVYAERGKQVSAGMQRKVEDGWFAGPAPLGYKNVRDQWGSYIVVDEKVAPLICEAFLLVAQGVPLRMALREMTRRGMVTKKGKPLSFSAFHLMIHNPFYIGYIQYQGKLQQGKHQALISREDFEKVQYRLGLRAYNP